MPIKLRQPTRKAGRGVIPRIGSSLYTAKDPVRCPRCGGTSLARKGARRKKFEIVQRWQCAACGRGFTPAPPELRAKTYPLRVILEAVTLYNLGHLECDVAALADNFGADLDQLFVQTRVRSGSTSDRQPSRSTRGRFCWPDAGSVRRALGSIGSRQRAFGERTQRRRGPKPPRTRKRVRLT
jgi:DNA-directed RNA polymerase subunit RPC12/RpoP